MKILSEKSKNQNPKEILTKDELKELVGGTSITEDSDPDEGEDGLYKKTKKSGLYCNK